MFLQSLSRDLKNMTHRKEFFFVLLLSLVLILGSLVLDFFSFYKSDVIYLKPAWYYWGAKGYGYETNPNYGCTLLASHTISLFLAFLLPFISACAYSSCHYDNAQCGIVKQLLPRTGLTTYYRSIALTTFLGGCLVVLLPLIFEQIILGIACPKFNEINVGIDFIKDDYAMSFIKVTSNLKSLQINHPYLFNLLYCIIPSITGGVLAYCSYTLSLFLRVNRFLIITIVGIIGWILIPFAFLGASLRSTVLGGIYQINTDGNILHWLIATVSLLLANVILTELKIHRFRDVI